MTTTLITRYYKPNLTLATTLVLHGFELLDVRSNEDEKIKLFVFEETPELKNKVKEFWRGELLVDPQEFSLRRESLMKRIREC